MPNLGPTELIIILVIIIVVFGAGKLAGVGGALGQGVKEFRDATKEAKGASEDVQAVADEVTAEDKEQA